MPGNPHTFVVPVKLIAISILHLRAMPRICTAPSAKPGTAWEGARTVEEQRVVRARVLDEPAHGVEHVLARRDLARVLRVVGEHDDVLRLVAAVPCARVSLRGGCRAEWGTHARGSAARCARR